MTEGRSNNLVGCFIVSQFYPGQVLQHIFFGDISSQKAVDFFRFKRYSYRFFFLGIYISHTTNNFTGSQFFHQLAGTVDGCQCIVRIQTFFKFSGSICTKSDSLCRQTDIRTVKACCFKQNCFYIVCDHGIFSAHDTCDTDRFFSVTDHQNVFIHLAFLPVKSNKFFVFSGTAYMDLMICDHIQIIGMHRLTIFFHDIVCDIYQVVDRADAVGSQTSLHPFRGRTDFYIFYDSCAVTRAEIFVFYGYFHIIIDIFVITGSCYNRRNKFFTESSCCFSCDPQYTVAIYTVGSDLIFNHRIVQSQCLDRTRTDRGVFRENIDSVFRSFRIHFSCGAKFFDGTHHTVGIHTTQFSGFDLDSARSFLTVVSTCNSSSRKNNRNFVSFFYIWSAGNDLCYFIAYIYLADDQFICIRMFLNLFNLSDHDVFQIGIQ